MTSSGSQQRKKRVPSRLVFSDAHKGRACSPCTLCKESQARYTHPVSWKSADILPFVNNVCGREDINPESCICLNCRDNIGLGMRNLAGFKPRWQKRETDIVCYVHGCNRRVYKHTKLASKEIILQVLLSENPDQAPLPESQECTTDSTPLCELHYRALHKLVKPSDYQWSCPACGVGIKGSNYYKCRTCPNAALLEDYLKKHTDFDSYIEPNQKLCSSCYKFYLMITKATEETPISTDEDFSRHLDSLKSDIPPYPYEFETIEHMIEVACGLTILYVSNELLNNKAMLLPAVHKRFNEELELLSQLARQTCPQNVITARWLLNRAAYALGHHMAYTCVVRKHGTIIYRSGKELHALSHSLYMQSVIQPTAQKDIQVCKEVELNDTLRAAVLDELNEKLHNHTEAVVKENSSTTFDISSLGIKKHIDEMDPVLGNAVEKLTQTRAERQGRELYARSRDSVRLKSLRQFFILCCIVYCIDSRCSTPLHVPLADIIDCCGGSTELIQILNRLGVCSSMDTLLRHIQQTVQLSCNKGLLQDMVTSKFTIFSVDNIDFLHSHAQVFCGNQQLSWHGTTIQALQPHVSPQSLAQSHDSILTTNSHDEGGTSESAQSDTANFALHMLPCESESIDSYERMVVSPIKITSRRRKMNTPTKPTSISMQSPLRKKSCPRPRTGTEAEAITNEQTEIPTTHPIHAAIVEQTKLVDVSIETFQLSAVETRLMDSFDEEVMYYFLLKNAYTPSNKTFVGIQEYFAGINNAQPPQPSSVGYVGVLDERADSKETLLYTLNLLHEKYVMKHGKKWVVIEGDALTYDIIQSLKSEYGAELNWVLPYPGDWHLLKNYQLCLMKPFFEAGLRDLACVCGYPTTSIQKCTHFQRTHKFLIETWESILRHILKLHTETQEGTTNLNEELAHTLHELANESYDQTAIGCVIRSLKEKLDGFHKEFKVFMSEKEKMDDTWKFWVGFVYRVFLPYISLFIAIRSGNWQLRVAAIKSMAADFTAFDHPMYQRLLTNHILDLMQMPSEVIQFFEGGGFVVSIKGRHFHSVAIDEAHEMLINKQTKQAIVRPTKDYINRIAQYTHVYHFAQDLLKNSKKKSFLSTKRKQRSNFHPLQKTL